jgi:hypothetical protein
MLCGIHQVSHHEFMRSLLVASLVASFAASPALAGNLCVASTVEDKRIAKAVAQELSARYERAVRLTSSLKALRVLTRPGCRGNVTLDIYELTEPSNFISVEALAREAQAAVPQAAAVSLRFYEREVWVNREDAGGHRGKEKLLKAVTLPSPQSEAAPRRNG